MEAVVAVPNTLVALCLNNQVGGGWVGGGGVCGGGGRLWRWVVLCVGLARAPPWGVGGRDGPALLLWSAVHLGVVVVGLTACL